MEASDILHNGLISLLGDSLESANDNALTLAQTVVSAPPIGLHHSISLLRSQVHLPNMTYVKHLEISSVKGTVSLTIQQVAHVKHVSS